MQLFSHTLHIQVEVVMSDRCVTRRDKDTYHVSLQRATVCRSITCHPASHYPPRSRGFSRQFLALRYILHICLQHTAAELTLSHTPLFPLSGETGASCRWHWSVAYTCIHFMCIVWQRLLLLFLWPTKYCSMPVHTASMKVQHQSATVSIKSAQFSLPAQRGVCILIMEDTVAFLLLLYAQKLKESLWQSILFGYLIIRIHIY